MYKYIIRFFGLKGSWSWACKQMEKGFIVKKNKAVSVKLKLDNENQRRIVWSFTHDKKNTKWSNANIFLSDFECVDWEVW